ncbi:hypothetical protein [Bacteroides sp.]|uniref:hypothetical protein n=1 Tax=Bacteroides sp. TaxID=29523 RepID=UPI002A7FE225|nr:hypothetical protein [Bacteroides sp.]
MKEISNIVVIDRDDYDELVEKANTVDAEIQKRAKQVFMKENEVPVRIEFNEYRNGRNFTAPIGFIRHSDSNNIWEALDKIEPQVKDWMDENLKMFDKKLREKYITEKNCIGLSKQVVNLEERLRRLKIKYTFLFSYAVVISAIVFFLLSLLKP